MKTVVVKPEFAGLTEEQVIDAIDAYEAQVDEYYANKGDEEECGCGCSHDDEGSCEDSDDDVIPSDDPIVLEVERLIAAYSDRFDELCKENGEVPEEALTYKPRTPIEQVAFDIFTDAQLAKILQIGDTFKEENALDVLIGVFHFIDGFMIFNIIEAHQAPVLEHSGVKKVLIYCDKLISQ